MEKQDIDLFLEAKRIEQEDAYLWSEYAQKELPRRLLDGSLEGCDIDDFSRNRNERFFDLAKGRGL